jgi:hypothetical protein
VRLITFTALACALLVPASQAHAQPAAPAMTMHRTQAGELDATGWTTAASTHGRFSVRLPLKFNDFTVAEADAGSKVDKIFTVGTRSSEGLKFVASRMTYRKPGAATDFFGAAERREGFAAKASQHRKLDYRGFRAVEILISERGAVLYQRLVLAGPDLISLTLEAPREHDALARDLLPRFFDSLAVAKK